MSTRLCWYSNRKHPPVQAAIPFNDYYTDSCEDDDSWSDVYDYENDYKEDLHQYYCEGACIISKKSKLLLVAHFNSVWTVDKIRKLPFKVDSKTHFIAKPTPCVKPFTEPVGDVLVLHKKGRVSFTNEPTYLEEDFHGPTRQQVVVVD
jgi:hypothetical protein